MKFAVNYSLATADLVHKKKIAFDLLKCPAWRATIEQARKIQPVYAHLPLRVGLGIADAYDQETKQTADWIKLETLLKDTATPFVNVHLAAFTRDYPDIPINTNDPAHAEFLAAQMIRDIRAIVARCGAERVIVENGNDTAGRMIRPALFPDLIRRVVEETGAGFLFDLSHARLAADYLGIDTREYIAALPMHRVREMHVTGLQRIEGHWLTTLEREDAAFAKLYAGRLMDHLPMTEADWDWFAWTMQQIRAGAWARPEIIAFEYGGIGNVWQAITDADALATQVPRLRAMINQLTN